MFFSSYGYMELLLEDLKKTKSPLRKRMYVAPKGIQAARFAKVIKTLELRPHKQFIVTVLGSSLGEGIEFPEGMLDGIMVVGPGFPTIDFENSLLQSYHENGGEDGFNLSVLYPAVSKVVQAVGRLIRRETDRGFILLIGDQYATEYYRYLPRYLYEQIHDVFPGVEWKGILKKFLAHGMT